VSLLPSVEGLKLSATYSKTFQLHLYIPKSIFRVWSWVPLSENDTQNSSEEKNSNQLAAPLMSLIGMLEFACPNHLEKNTGDAFYLEWNEGLDRLCFKYAFLINFILC